MPIIIDGHNLIPKIPGLSLSDIDDEVQLVQVLQEYARLRRKQVEVFFDNSPVGRPRIQRFGTITVKYSRPGHTADEEIRGRLERLGKAARNWTVVSSDHRVQGYARATRATWMTAEEFSNQMQNTLDQDALDKGETIGKELSMDEVSMWLEIFNEKKANKDSKSKKN